MRILYLENGQTYNQSGIYTYRTLNIHGCDSIVTLDLTVFPSIDVAMTHAACDTFKWNGQSYTQSGIYTFQAQTQHGCDSTVTLDLTISDVLHTELPVTACDSYTWNGQTYDTAGDYTFTGISMSGCDSIATLRLSILSSTFSNESQTACTSFTWNNQTYDQSGTYLFQTKNAQGCDSTATLYLTVHQPTTSEQWVTACDSYYWDNDPFVHNTSGTYTQIIRNKNGCDSLMTLHLLISNSTSDTLDVSACEVYYINGSIPIFNDVKFILEAKIAMVATAILCITSRSTSQKHPPPQKMYVTVSTSLAIRWIVLASIPIRSATSSIVTPRSLCSSISCHRH
ncbi:MAG: hypothetical protein IPG00_08515 [Saprospiraceae bacterium]|nr:hypothetical protein [Saprospiraceae bacterium]